jgi:hypothetical protein
MNSLLLDRTTWDLCKDANGNIALASNPYAVAQDVACAVQTFLGEVWYDTTQGVDWFGTTLGQSPPAPFIQAKVETVAKAVPDVQDARCTITGLSGRNLSGTLLLTVAGSTVTLTLTGDSSGLTASIGAG